MFLQSRLRKNTSFKITSIAKSRPASNDGEDSGDESADDTEDISDNIDNSNNAIPPQIGSVAPNQDSHQRGVSGINFSANRQNSKEQVRFAFVSILS